MTPDFIFVAKTLTAGHIPLSAVITKKKFREKIIAKFGRVLHCTTFQGHSLQELQQVFPLKRLFYKNKILQNINNMGNYLKKNLLNELKDHDFFL